MPHENTSSQILTALDDVNQLQFNLLLLDIALEHCKTYTEENYDRVHLLLELLRGVHECHLDNLHLTLTKLSQVFTPLETKEKSTVFQTCLF